MRDIRPEQLHHGDSDQEEEVHMVTLPPVRSKDHDLHPFFSAVQSHDWDRAHGILAVETAVANIVNDRGQTALHRTLLACHPPATLIRLLLSLNPGATLVQANDGLTPLQCSLSYRVSDEIIKMLLQANPKATSIRNFCGATPLLVACVNERSYGILHALLRADINQIRSSDREGTTPSFEYFRRAHVKVLVAAAQYGKSATNDGTASDHDILFGGISDREWVEIHDIASLLLQAEVHSTIDNPLPNGVQYNMIHASLVANSCPPTIVDLATKFHPEQVRLFNTDGNLPVHVATGGKVMALWSDFNRCDLCYTPTNFMDDTLSSTALYFRERDVMGGDVFCEQCFLEMEVDKSLFEIVTSVNKIVQSIKSILRSSPDSASIPNASGRLPLSLALESRLQWDTVLEPIRSAAPTALRTRDVTSFLFPFMIAAVSKKEEHKTTDRNEDVAGEHADTSGQMCCAFPGEAPASFVNESGDEQHELRSSGALENQQVEFMLYLRQTETVFCLLMADPTLLKSGC